MPGLQIAHFGLAKQYSNLKEELLDATDRALKDGQLVNGHYTRSFEEWLKHRTGTKYAITVHSGTQALEIIARYKKRLHNNVMEGNPIVRIPNLTYPATLNAFINAGWDIILADTDKNGILRLEHEGKRIAGIYDCLVGLYGLQPWQGANIESSFGVIVDGAQHWLECNNQVGSAMSISFDPTKNLPASGNGGAIVTNDNFLNEFALSYRDNNKPEFNAAGTNTKMSEQDCAQILVRASYINEWQNRRKQISKYWCEQFKDLPIRCLSDTQVPHAHQKFVIYSSNRNELNHYLLYNGIQTKIHYEYVLGDLQMCLGFSKPDMLSTSVMLSRGVLSLPMYPELTDIEVEYIANKVKSFQPK